MKYLRLFYRILSFWGLEHKMALTNQPCYDKYGRFLGWFSRSIAVVVFVFAKDKDGDWCVLASERGKDAADFNGMWNCCCGYLDFGETTKEAACREVHEETGVDIPIDSLEFIGYEDNPITANRQNVTFRFLVKIEDRQTCDFKFSKKDNEGDEVGEIAWIKEKDIDRYKWAFEHNQLLKEIFKSKQP